ncbi:MAG: nucleoside-triphosphatase [Bacillota bacterium]|jgi:nucleoside-triphosphatase
MSNCLFLQGDMKVGKSTLLLESVHPYLACTGGFMVQRLFSGEHLKAFCLHQVAAEPWSVNAEYKGNEANIFLQKTDHGWQSFPEVFTRIGPCLPQWAKKNKLMLLDEIGGVELLSEVFWENLYQVLGSGIPCIGVVKSLTNSKIMQESVALSDRYQKLHKQLLTDIKGKFSGEIMELTTSNRPFVKQEIAAFLKRLDF